MARRRTTARSGFSLVEVLAALAATVLVIAAFSPFVAQLIASWGRGARTAEFADMLQTASARLDKDVRSAVPLFVTREDTTSMVFRGAPGYVLFAAATGYGSGRAGLELLSIAAETVPEGVALVRRHAPLGTDPQSGGFRDPVVLLSGRYRISFTYVAADGKRTTEWLDKPSMPARVEVTVASADGTPVLPAPLAFLVPADYPAACVVETPPDACSELDQESGQPEDPQQ